MGEVYRFVKSNSQHGAFNRVFTQPENDDSTLAKIENTSNNLADFLSQHVVTKKSSLEDIEKISLFRSFRIS